MKSKEREARRGEQEEGSKEQGEGSEERGDVNTVTVQG